MKTVTENEFCAMTTDRKYYSAGGHWMWKSRAAYCCSLIEQVPSVKNRALEVGPYQTPLVPGSDIMDHDDHGLVGFNLIQHDAGATPWPVADKYYDLVVACAVWEHLKGKQRAAWLEVKRVADWCVWLVPFEWTEYTGKDSHNVTEAMITEWTGGSVRIESRFIGKAPWQVYAALYRC